MLDHQVSIAGTPTMIRDVWGRDSILFRFADGDTSISRGLLEQVRQ